MSVEQSSEYLEFPEALAEGLTTWGDDLLRTPKRLVGHVSDLLDVECIELRVLYMQCDADLLDPFLSIDYSDVNALRQAERIMFERLRTERLVEADAARRTAHGIAAGIALWAGVPYDSDGESSLASRSRNGDSVPLRQASLEAQQLDTVPFADLDEPEDYQRRRVLSSRVPLVDERSGTGSTPKVKEPIDPVGDGPRALIRILAVVGTIVVGVALVGSILAGGATKRAKDESGAVSFEHRDTDESSDVDSTDSSTAGEENAAFLEVTGVPEDTSIPIEGSYGTWLNGVYTSEVLGIRITPNESLVPMYESSYYGHDGFDDLASMIWSEFCYSAELDKSSVTSGKGMIACPVTLKRWPDEAHFDGEKLEIDGETLEQVEFCGSRWFVWDVTATPGDFNLYFKPVNDAVVYIEIPVLGDKDANEQVMSAFSAL